MVRSAEDRSDPGGPVGAAGTGEPGDDLARMADRLHSLSIRLLRTVREEDAATGLSAPRLSALSVLVFAGERSMGELAAAEQVRPPTMTRLVQALEADGLAVREPDPSDARQVRVRATARGRAILEEGRRRRVAALVARLEALPASARADVTRAVQALEGAFGVRSRRPSG